MILRATTLRLTSHSSAIYSSPLGQGLATNGKLRQGFGQRLRLLDSQQFADVFAHKRRAHGMYFNTHVAPNRLWHARIGLAVSRRVSKRAVVRNRIKRVIRESFRCQQHTLGAIDYVVIAKLDAAARDTHELRAELDNLWIIAGKRCKKI